MRKNRRIVTASLVLALVFLAACAPRSVPQAAAPVPAIPAPKAATATPKTPAKPAWQVEWEKVLEAATREGKVAIYSGAGSDAGRPIVAAFRQKYGIPVEWVGVASVNLGEKLVSERRAGIYSYDAYITGTTTQVTVLKPAGVFDPMDPALILPDVTDPELIKKTWWKGKLSFVDKDRMILTYEADPKNPITVNTDIVKPGEVKSYKDLLQPKFKGKIVLNDPTVRGPGGKGFAAALAGKIVDEAYWRQLAKQDVVVSRDLRLQVDWVARGKYAVVLDADPVPVNDFMKLGAPITQILPAEGTYVSASHGNITLINKAPHPNAAKVFINWLLSQEGQTVALRAFMGQSRRLDVPTDHLLPTQIRQEGMEYWDAENEEYLKTESRYYAVAKEIFNIP